MSLIELIGMTCDHVCGFNCLDGSQVQAKLSGPRIVAPGEVLTFRLALD